MGCDAHKELGVGERRGFSESDFYGLIPVAIDRARFLAGGVIVCIPAVLPFLIQVQCLIGHAVKGGESRGAQATGTGRRG